MVPFFQTSRTLVIVVIVVVVVVVVVVVAGLVGLERTRTHRPQCRASAI